MTETEFIEKNKEKWRELEVLLASEQRDADRLQELFVQVSSDLSYARTFYANRSVRLYLNNLTQQVFDIVRKRRNPMSLSSVMKFFGETLPQEILRARSAFLVSFLVFLISVAIGVISSANNPEFARVILGDAYIQYTEANINRGDPMAIYKEEQKTDMFLGITFNNIEVAFLAFVLGLFGSMGTIVLLISNGVMLGVFQYYFYSKGLFLTSFLTIWIHGTIEISAIIIAGAAGIVLGNGLLFPGTYDRLQSLQIHAKRALRILLGTVPLFILAAILESFVTRYTALPVLIKGGIIGGSLLLVVLMWIILPWKQRGKKGNDTDVYNLQPEEFRTIKFDRQQFRSFGDRVVLVFSQLRMVFGSYLKFVVLPGMLLFGIFNWYKLNALDLSFDDLDVASVSLLQWEWGGVTNFIVLVLIFGLALLLLGRFVLFGKSSIDLAFIKQYMPSQLVVAMLLILPFYCFSLGIGMIIFLALIPHALFLTSYSLIEQSRPEWQKIFSIYQFNASKYIRFLPAVLTLAFFALLLALFLHSGLTSIISVYLSWHELFPAALLDQIFIDDLFSLLGVLLCLPFAYFLFVSSYFSERCWAEATDLRAKFESFGRNTTVLER
ncbi:MAG: stage II sporulation protein M [Saprospiraceae bacterium]|nr:stage II sporulation protein M [Saprospiraceae bacterium]